MLPNTPLPGFFAVLTIFLLIAIACSCGLKLELDPGLENPPIECEIDCYILFFFVLSILLYLVEMKKDHMH